MSRPIRRTTVPIIHRSPRKRPRAIQPAAPWYEDRPKRGRPRTSTNPLSTTARGYGNAHQVLRKRIARLVESGLATCSRCGQPILVGQLWHLDHDDTEGAHRAGWYRGPSHASCNNRAKNKKAANIQQAQQTQQKRAPALSFFDTKPTTK